MDFNALFNKCVESAVEAQKGKLIKQTLDEDHDYIMFRLKSIFGETYGHLDNYLKKTCLYQDESKKILNIITNMMNDVEETVTGKKVEKTDKVKTENVITDKDEIVMVDSEGRITIPTRILEKAYYPTNSTVKILKDDNAIYIVKENTFEYNKHFVKYRTLSKDSFRLGIANLLNVNFGDTVKIKVDEKQKIVIEPVRDMFTDNPELLDTVTLYIDKNNRLYIPNYILIQANLTDLCLNFFLDEELVLITPEDEIEDDFIKLDKTAIVRDEPLRFGAAKLLKTKPYDAVKVEIYNGQLMVWKEF